MSWTVTDRLASRWLLLSEPREVQPQRHMSEPQSDSHQESLLAR